MSEDATPVTRALDQLDVPYRLFRHPGPVRSLAQAARERGQQPEQIIRSLLFRFSADEFVLVLPGTGKEQALEFVERIRARMKETTYLAAKGLEVHMSASFGIATYPDDAADRESLLALADEAMFRIKSRGKDAVGTTP